jgi:3-hydroxyisobutyrate dehydrogenase
MMKIGFIGTGTMGLPMLHNLLKTGFSAVAYDAVAVSLDNAVKIGAARAASAAEVAKASDLVITMLPSGANVEAVYLGANGVIEGAGANRLCVDMSTIDPGTSQRVANRLKNRAIRFIDAPVSGAVGRAADGTLTIMVGGAAADLEEARPALAAMGTNIIHVGPVGAGEVAKLCNNLIAGVAIVAVSEAFRIGEAYGVDLRILTDVIAKSSGGTWVMQHGHPVPGIDPATASSRDYAPGFMTDLMAKDLGLVVNAAREKRVPVVAAPAAQQLYRLASSNGFGRKDCSSVYQFIKPSGSDAPV